MQNNTNIDLLKRSKALAKTIAFMVTIWVLGWIVFVWIVHNGSNSSGGKMPVYDADAVVILTGAQDRITQGLKLFAASNCKKLLISGVGEGVTLGDLTGSLNEVGNTQTRSNIILGTLATTTLTNAEEAKIFININKFKSMILVTSDYHMPRSQLIFRYMFAGDIDIKHHWVGSKFDKNFIAAMMDWTIFLEYNKSLATIVLIGYQQFLTQWDKAVQTIVAMF